MLSQLKKNSVISIKFLCFIANWLQIPFMSIYRFNYMAVLLYPKSCTFILESVLFYLLCALLN